MAESEEASAALRLHVWVDAQLPPSLARWLTTEHGIEARHVQELGLLQSRDPDIFSAAGGAAEPVAILTKDDDFASS